MHRPPPRQSGQQGVILIEVMIAILIFSIGVLALVGLQATMIKNTAEAKYRSEASYIAQSRIGQIWADTSLAATVLGWKATRTLEDSLRSAWKWERHLQENGK